MSRYGGVDLPFESATRVGWAGRIALAEDPSGSIGESLLKRFAAKVVAVLVQTEPVLCLIICDADVHQIYDFSGHEGAKIVRRFRLCGLFLKAEWKRRGGKTAGLS